MYVVHLDSGIFYQASGVVDIRYTNPATYDLQIIKTLIWGGVSIGAVMDMTAELYLTGPENNLVSVGDTMNATGWMPLDYLAFDRYGASNGQPYQHWWDWRECNVNLHPGQQLALQASCVQHGTGTNPVMGTPYANDNCQAQAYIWMK